MNALRTREVWEAPARRLETSDKPTQGKGDVTATQKSYCLIVLRDRESLLHGEAGNGHLISSRETYTPYDGSMRALIQCEEILVYGNRTGRGSSKILALTL